MNGLVFFVEGLVSPPSGLDQMQGDSYLVSVAAGNKYAVPL